MLFIFDLDFTLWDCGGTWCDCTTPPYRVEGGRVLDTYHNHIRLYPDVRSILDTVLDQGHTVAVASRTHEPSWARELLRLLEVENMIDHMEIYPGPKKPHLKSLRRKSGLGFDEMVFFDDEQRNIEDIRRLGVRSVFVRQGLTWSHVRPFLKQ